MSKTLWHRVLAVVETSPVCFSFALPVVIVLMLWGLSGRDWTADSNDDFNGFYDPVARNILAGKGLVTSDGSLAVRYPPGFPIILAAVYAFAEFTGAPEELCLIAFTLGSLGIATVLLYLIAEISVGKRRALLAAALWASYPLQLWFAQQPNSEIGFLPLFLGSVLACSTVLWTSRRRGWLLLFCTGVLAGVAALVRPIALLLGPVLAVSFFFLRRRDGWQFAAAGAGLIVAGALAVTLPWEISARRATGSWIPLSTGGVVGMQDGLTFASRTGVKGYRNHIDVDADVLIVMEAAVKKRDRREIETAAQVGGFIASELRARPAGVVKLLTWKAARAWYGTDALRASERYVLAIQLIYLIMAVLGAYLLWSTASQAREWVVLTAMIVALFWGMTTISLSIARYMVPAMALLFPAVSVFLCRISEKLGTKVRRLPVRDETAERAIG